MRKPDRLMMGVPIAAAVVGVDLVATFLWTGQIDIQKPPIDRANDPYYYWAETILLALGLIVMPLWMLYREWRKR